MSFLVAVSSSTVWRIRPSSWPNHCWPAMRSAPLASNTLQPCRVTRPASSRRNEVLPTSRSPLTSSGRIAPCCKVAAAVVRTTRQSSGSTKWSGSARSAQKRPNVVRKARSMLPRTISSSSATSALASGWSTRSRKARTTACGAANGSSSDRAEVGDVAKLGAAGEIIPHQQRKNGVVAPPFLGAGHGGADRRPRLRRQEIFEREIHRPRRNPVELRDHLIERLAAVVRFARAPRRPCRRAPSWPHARIAARHPRGRPDPRARGRPA